MDENSNGNSDPNPFGNLWDHLHEVVTTGRQIAGVIGRIADPARRRSLIARSAQLFRAIGMAGHDAGRLAEEMIREDTH